MLCMCTMGYLKANVKTSCTLSLSCCRKNLNVNSTARSDPLQGWSLERRDSCTGDLSPRARLDGTWFIWSAWTPCGPIGLICENVTHETSLWNGIYDMWFATFPVSCDVSSFMLLCQRPLAGTCAAALPTFKKMVRSNIQWQQMSSRSGLVLPGDDHQYTQRLYCILYRMLSNLCCVSSSSLGPRPMDLVVHISFSHYAFFHINIFSETNTTVTLTSSFWVNHVFLLFLLLKEAHLN